MSTPADELRSHLRQALSALSELRHERDELLRSRAEPIAIIGMGCRLPGGGHDLAAFWDLLIRGVDAVREIPAARWPAGGAAGAARAARWAGLLEQIDLFDAAFFGISPRESICLDPQQRLLLEVTWEALERAGQPTERLVGSQTGVFMGVIHPDYRDLNGLADPSLLGAYGATGSALSSAAGRISYLLGLNGPCMTVDTACSSSLVAVHLACQSLRSGESTLALAGGVNLLVSPLTMQMIASTNTLSPDGRCRTFDARANGTVRGEGCGVVVLKRLSDAQRDGDPVLALVRGSAVNHDGRSTGFTAPSVLSQQALLRKALASAQVAPEQIGYVEAHGTATPLGDPIELEALKEVLGQPRPGHSECFLSSVKTNLGHLEAAAGITGLIKTVLVLQHQRIPPHLHFATLNPRISLAGTPFVIPRTERPWPPGSGPRFAGVSSFGLSGTNAHVVLEEAAATKSRPPQVQTQAQVLLLTAKTEPALRAMAEKYRVFLTAPGPTAAAALVDIAYTASVRRSHYPYRLAVTGETKQEWAAALSAFSKGELPPGSAYGYAPATQRPKLVFIFSGQGSQWLGMGRQLLTEEPVFRKAMQDCDAAVRSEAGWSLIEELLAEPAGSHLDRSAVLQPMLFAVAVALARLYKSWGVEADAVIGHSMGEVAAAHVCGALSLADAARIICRRSALLQKLSGLGAAAQLMAPLTEVQQLLAGQEAQLAVAASNGPRSTVVAGELAAMEALLEELTRKGVLFQRVRVDVGSHSPQIDPLRDELLSALVGLRSLKPQTPMYSTVTGGPVHEGMLDAAYWYRNMREPVLLWPTIERLKELGYELFVEVSPHPVLAPAVQNGLLEGDHGGTALATLRRGQPERRAIQATLAALCVRGRAVAWARLYPAEAQCVELPTYPWQRERFWLDSPAQGLPQTGQQPVACHAPEAHPLIGRPFQVSTQPNSCFWEQAISLSSLAYLGDHRVHGEVVFPGCGYVEMAVAAARQVRPDEDVTLLELQFERMLIMAQPGDSTLQTVLSTDGADSAQLQISDRSSGKWVRHAAGTLVWTRAMPKPPLQDADLAAIKQRCARHITKQQHYQHLQELGIELGPCFQGVQELWVGGREALARVVAPPAIAKEVTSYWLHPSWLDACLQTVTSSIDPAGAALLVIVGIKRLEVYRAASEAAWVHSTITLGQTLSSADLLILSEDRQPLARASGILIQRVSDKQQSAAAVGQQQWLHEVAWRRQPLPQPDVRPAASDQTWLIFLDQRGTGAAVRSALQHQGARCILVEAGDQYRRLGTDRYQLNPTQGHEYHTLLQDALGKGGCSGVVHLWSLESPPDERMTTEQLAHEQRLGCHSALNLVQSVLRMGFRQVPRLWLVLRGSQGVTAADTAITVSQAPLWGLGQAIAREHPELLCTRVDLSVSPTAAEVALLVDELQAGAREEQVALRGTERFVARLQQGTLQLPKLAEEPRLQDNGTYLISGGLSGLGLEAAECLAIQGARHLVLLGRRPPDESANAALKRMRALGVQVLVAQVDVSRYDRLAALMAELSGKWPPLRGIIHCAAVLDDGILLEQSWERFEHVMAPKMYGAWNLHLATLTEPLDFFIGYSSAASLLGVIGQGNYIAANAFVDALAHCRRRAGRCGLSVNWGAVDSQGMAARLPEVAQRMSQNGVRSLPLTEVNHILLRLLESAPAQVGVIDLDVHTWLAAFPSLADSPYWSELVRAPEKRQTSSPLPGAQWRRKLLEASPEVQPRLVTQFLAEQLSQVLRLPASRIDIKTPLMHLGFDSLMAVELRNRLDGALGVSVSVPFLLRDASVVQLGAHVLELLLAPVNEDAEELAEGAV